MARGRGKPKQRGPSDEVQQTEIRERYQLYRLIVLAVAAIVALATLALPLWVIAEIADSFEDSKLDVSVTTGSALVLTVTLGGGGYKIVAQTRDKRRLRETITTLEQENQELRDERDMLKLQLEA